MGLLLVRFAGDRNGKGGRILWQSDNIPIANAMEHWVATGEYGEILAYLPTDPPLDSEEHLEKMRDEYVGSTEL